MIRSHKFFRASRHHQFRFSVWRRVGPEILFLQDTVGRRQSCFYPRTVTHLNSLFLHRPAPCFSGSSSLAFFVRYPLQRQCNARRELLSIRSTYPIHVHLLLTWSLIVSMLALFCTSSFHTRIGQKIFKSLRRHLCWISIQFGFIPLCHPPRFTSVQQHSYYIGLDWTSLS